MDTMQQACHNILLHSCSLEKGEDLVMLCDITGRELAHKLAETAAGAGGFPYLFEIGFERELDAFPKPAVQLLENVHFDALILLSSPNLWINLRLSDHLHAHRGIAGLQARTLFIPPFPIDSLLRMASADVVAIEAYAGRLLDTLEKAKDLRVWAPEGTDVRFTYREFYLFKYKVSKPGDYAIYHVAEVTTTPFESTVNGTIVYDGGTFAHPNPLRLVVKDGRVVDFVPLGEYDERTKWFENELFEKGDENARIVGEFALGINPNCNLGDCHMEDECRRGTCHLDLGDNIDLGGQNKSNAHMGGVILAPTVEVNGRKLLIDGKLIGYDF